MSNITALPPPELAALDALIIAGNHLRIEDSLALLSVAVLFYDYMITFSDEVELIWKTKMTPINILFIINRYFGPMAIIICMVALFSPTWTLNFEGVFTEVTVLVAEVMLILRVYAIHKKNKVVLAILATVWVTQLCLMSFTLANSGPVIVPQSPVTFGCILVANPKIGALDILFVVPSIAFDTITITLLLLGLYLRTEMKTASSLFKVLFRDGVLYFAVVVIINTAWMVTGLALETDLKNILSFLSTVMTNVLIGRLTLNLKRQGNKADLWGEQLNYPLLPSRFTHRKFTTSSTTQTLSVNTPADSKLPYSPSTDFHRSVTEQSTIVPYDISIDPTASLRSRDS